MKFSSDQVLKIQINILNFPLFSFLLTNNAICRGGVQSVTVSPNGMTFFISVLLSRKPNPLENDYIQTLIPWVKPTYFALEQFLYKSPAAC